MTEYNVKLRSLKVWEIPLVDMFYKHNSTYTDINTKVALNMGFFTGLLWCADVPLKTKPLDWKKICYSKYLDKAEMFNYAVDVCDELELLGINNPDAHISLLKTINVIVIESMGLKVLEDGELTANFS